MAFKTLFRGCNVPGTCGPTARTVYGAVDESTDSTGNTNMLAWLAAFDFDNFTVVGGSSPTSLAWGGMYKGFFSTPSLTAPDSDLSGGEGGAGSGADVAGLFDSQNFIDTDGTNYVFIATRTQVYVPAKSQYFIINLEIEGAFQLGCAGLSDGCQIIELPTPQFLPGSSFYNIYEMGVASSTFGKTDLTDWVAAYISTMTSEGSYSGTTPPTYGPGWNASATCQPPEDDPFTGDPP